MRRDEFQTMFEYDTWATERLLTAAAPLTPEGFSVAAGPGHAPLCDTLAHIARARWGFRLLLGSTPSSPSELMSELLAQHDFSTTAGARAFFEAEQAAMAATLRSLSDADLETTIEVRGRKRARVWQPWQIVTHVVNHGTQHRSELAEALTLLGHSPGNLDLAVYLDPLTAADGPRHSG